MTLLNDPIKDFECEEHGFSHDFFDCGDGTKICVVCGKLNFNGVKKEPTKPIHMTKRVFNKLRKYAKHAYLYTNTETSAILYGKNDKITRCKHIKDSVESKALVSSTGEKILDIMNERGFMGFFHSHTFGSNRPSTIDVSCLSGWTCYKEKRVFSIIAAYPLFSMAAWSMDDELDVREHEIIIV